jgi:hypothetical protein
MFTIFWHPGVRRCFYRFPIAFDELGRPTEGLGSNCGRFRAARTMVCRKLLDAVDWLWPLKANALPQLAHFRLKRVSYPSC